jgi:hypothetical protein
VNHQTNLVKLKLWQAKKHVRELDRVIAAFFQGKPFIVEHHTEPETGDVVFKMKRCYPIPWEIPLIIGDVLQNCGSALDHLVWHLVKANGGKPTENNSFPFSKSAATYTQTARMRLKGVHPAAAKLIDDVKPYPGGHEDLYSMHYLNNHDKHRMILVVGAAHTAVTYSTRVKMWIPKREYSFPLATGKVLCRVPREYVPFMGTPNFGFRIAFGDSGVMKEGDPVMPNLKGLPAQVASIIHKFDEFLR